MLKSEEDLRLNSATLVHFEPLIREIKFWDISSRGNFLPCGMVCSDKTVVLKKYKIAVNFFIIIKFLVMTETPKQTSTLCLVQKELNNRTFLFAW